MSGRTAFTCTISGDKELKDKIRLFGKRGVIAAMRGVRATAVDILADAKRRLLPHMATGKLFNSGKVVKDEDDANLVDVVFSGGGDGFSDYAEYVEFGRIAGKPPPYKAILEWVKKKGIADTWSIKTKRQNKRDDDYHKRAVSAAIAISKSIGANGTKAHPFLFPAFEDKRDNLTTNIEKELQKLIDSL